MITRFLTNVSASFNPFSPKAKATRIFLALFPADTRQAIKIDTKVLPRSSRERSSIWVKFSEYLPQLFPPKPNHTISPGLPKMILTAVIHTEDGKEMKLDAEKLGIKSIVEEIDRHSRSLARKEDLGG
jgi:large subunit ribosomal protein L53